MKAELMRLLCHASIHKVSKSVVPDWSVHEVVRMVNGLEERAKMQAGPCGKIIGIFGDKAAGNWQTEEVDYSNLLLLEKKPAALKRPAAAKKKKKKKTKAAKKEKKPTIDSEDDASEDQEEETCEEASSSKGEKPASTTPAKPMAPLGNLDILTDFKISN